MKKSTLLIVALLIGVSSLIAFRLSTNKTKIDKQNKAVVTVNNAVPVTTATVAEGSVDQSLVKSGNLTPFREADIMATTSGKVTSVNFSLGSRVGRGATLVTLDNEQKRLQLQATELQIEKLRKDVTRYTTLLAGNATTEIQLNDVRFNYENALNQSAQLKKQMADAAIQSPLSGQIVAKTIEPGEFVTAGKVVGTVLDLSRLKVQVPVNESDVYSLHTGQPVKVSTDIFPDRIFNGRISYIAPQGNNEHSYPVEITIDGTGQLKAGTYVNVDFTRKSNQKALLIPRAALVESVQNPYVYLIEGNTAHRRAVELGRDLGDKLEVRSGLSAGNRIVTSGQFNQSDGKPVQITN